MPTCPPHALATNGSTASNPGLPAIAERLRENPPRTQSVTLRIILLGQPGSLDPVIPPQFAAQLDRYRFTNFSLEMREAGYKNRVFPVVLGIQLPSIDVTAFEN